MCHPGGDVNDDGRLDLATQSAAVPSLPAACRWTLGVFAVVVAATWWRPAHPAEQAMHHSLTVLGLVALVLVQRRRPLPYSSFLLILVFLVLHSVAAREISSFVPAYRRGHDRRTGSRRWPDRTATLGR